MKLTKNELRTIIKEELQKLNEAKNASVELSRMIKDLKIKDKPLEMVIRELVFSNNNREIEHIMHKFMPVMPELKLENTIINENDMVGHYKVKGKETFVDSSFVNLSNSMLGGALKHLGFGEFYLATSKGDIQFIRTSEKISGFVGRSHRLSDKEGGKLADKLVKEMEKTGKAEKV